MDNEPALRVRVPKRADVGKAYRWIQTRCLLVMKDDSKPESRTAGDLAGSQRVSGSIPVTD